MDIVRFSIPGKPKYVQMVRLAVGSIASQVGFDIEKIEDMTVAVGEACKLVTCHGQEKFSEYYDVVAQICEESVTITVSDFSSGHNIEKRFQQCVQCPQEGDLSTFIIESLMDKVETTENEKGNKKIIMVKNK
ncbi:MAG: ATP-binding protein [Eubacteriales bacterium]|nr:ATP-binding protein [Eubacteriales bacterium]MDD4389424.1 ATP-binding protein [Eubacteriales bacterium]